MDFEQFKGHFNDAAAEVEGKQFTGLTKETNIAELGLDSIATMQIIEEVEQSVGVTMTDEALAGVITLGDLYASIGEL